MLMWSTVLAPARPSDFTVQHVVLLAERPPSTPTVGLPTDGLASPDDVRRSGDLRILWTTRVVGAPRGNNKKAEEPFIRTPAATMEQIGAWSELVGLRMCITNSSWHPTWLTPHATRASCAIRKPPLSEQRSLRTANPCAKRLPTRSRS